MHIAQATLATRGCAARAAMCLCSLFFVFSSELNQSFELSCAMDHSGQDENGDDVLMGSDEDRDRSVTPQPPPPLSEKARGKKRARSRSATPSPAERHSAGQSKPSGPSGAGPPDKKSRTLPNQKKKRRSKPKQRDPFHLPKKEIEEPELKVCFLTL